MDVDLSMMETLDSQPVTPFQLLGLGSANFHISGCETTTLSKLRSLLSELLEPQAKVHTGSFSWAAAGVPEVGDPCAKDLIGLLHETTSCYRWK